VPGEEGAKVVPELLGHMDTMKTRGAQCSSPWWGIDAQDEYTAIVEDFEKGEFEMATRGMIARKTANGFIGRYHHFDAYPDGLGEALYNLYNGHFGKNAEAMMHTLIDEHPAGWSSIVDANFAFTPGFSERDYTLPDDLEINSRPQCYCHGVRHDPAQDITSFEHASRVWAEYAYIIDTNSHTMAVYSHYDGWQEIAVVNLDEPAPEWGGGRRLARATRPKEQ
jgi:hypothetical protein